MPMKPQGTFKIRGPWGSDWRWLGEHGWWYSESKAMVYTPREAETFPLPLGGEWVYTPAKTQEDNNEEEMDVSHRRDDSDDNPVTDPEVAEPRPTTPKRE